MADKELAKLIHDVAARGPHLVVPLDCCHSGSGTRNFAEGVRRLETDTRPRPLNSYFCTLEQIEELGVATRNVADRPSGWNMASKRGRHVLLAACRDDEEAKEYQGDGSHRGAFSYFLGTSLRTIGGETSYRSLFDRASALVRGQVTRQTPQLEATEPGDLDQPFLGGAIRPSPRHAVARLLDRRWNVDVGRINGIPEPTAEDTTVFALFHFGAKDEDLTDPAKAIGRAKAIRVESASSLIELEGIADPQDGPFKAVILHQPTGKLKVAFEGDGTGVDLVRSALKTAGPGGEPSLFVRPTEGREAADYRVIARDGRYLIVRPGDDRPLVDPVRSFSQDSARRVIERLEHIERWKATAELQSPNTSIAERDIEVKVIYKGEELKGREQRLAYDGEDPPRVTIKLKNNSRRPFFAGLLDLPNTFGIFSLQPDRSCQKLAPGEETAAHDGESMPASVPDQYWALGIGEITDIIKIIVSTKEFDVRRLMQEDLDVPDPERERRATRGMEEGSGQLRGGGRRISAPLSGSWRGSRPATRAAGRRRGSTTGGPCR